MSARAWGPFFSCRESVHRSSPPSSKRKRAGNFSAVYSLLFAHPGKCYVPGILCDGRDDDDDDDDHDARIIVTWCWKIEAYLIKN